MADECTARVYYVVECFPLLSIYMFLSVVLSIVEDVFKCLVEGLGEYVI